MQRFIFIWLFLFAVSLYAEENDSVGRTSPAPLGGESGERTLSVKREAWSVGREVLSVKREAVSAEHWGWQLDVNPCWILKADEYVSKWLKKQDAWAVDAQLRYRSLPSDNDAFAHDFGYPTLALGLSYHHYDGVVMHKDANPLWGMAQEVDYDSHLGNTVTLYGAFERPLFSNKHWELDYAMSVGLGYTGHKYNPVDAVDNELIGSHLLVYFGAGVHATYHFARNWGVKAGVEFKHHSNGALNRPNKGANALGPMIGVVWTPSTPMTPPTPLGGERTWSVKRGAWSVERGDFENTPFQKSWYMNFSLGFGGKVPLEDWQVTQFQTPPSDPDYRTGDFKLYAAYSLQADLMRRYARRWASGIGFDLFYGSYADHVASLDAAQGYTDRHSPWSVGIAAKHEVFYHRVSLAMSLGVYLHRQMGHQAKELETPYYERIGLKYQIPRLGGLAVGLGIKAHLLKADYTELVLSYPIKFQSF